MIAWMTACGLAPLPEAEFADLSVTSLDFTKAELAASWSVTNPWPVELGLVSASWDVAIAGRPLVSGVRAERLALAAGGVTPVPIGFVVVFEDLWRIASELRSASEVPYALRAELTFESPLGPLTLPLAHEGTVPVPRPPTISLAAVRLAAMDLYAGRATVEVDVRVVPDPTTPLTVSSLDWALTMGGGPVASGSARVAGTTLTLPVSLDLGQAAGASLTLVAAGQPVVVGLTGRAVVDTAWGPIPLAFDQSTTLPGL